MKVPKSVGAITLFNPWIGCAKVSAGCDNCYAESLAKRYGWHDWQNSTPRHLTSDAYWRQPIRWNINARAAGVAARVFCASLADVFDPHAPADARERLWELIAETPWLNWLILTKRPSPMRTMLPCVPQRLAVDFPNIWLGVSAEDQASYDQRMPLLAETWPTVRFVSYEPALGPLDMSAAGVRLPDWVIIGGESGHCARRMDYHWAGSVIAECRSADIAVFLKQWGHYRNNPLMHQTDLNTTRVKLHDPPSNGKGGALLDGRLIREFPPVPAPFDPDRLFAVAAG